MTMTASIMTAPARAAATIVAALCALTALMASQPAMAQSATAQSATAQSATKGSTRTDSFWSPSLGVQKDVRIYLPPSYHTSGSRRYPVLYYLHGLYGSEKNWIESGKIDVTMDSLLAMGKATEAIIVMPDGDDAWWTTANMFADMNACRADTVRKEPAATYCVPWLRYDDYVARDLVSYIDGKYRTVASRNGRGIGGLSMGGYGAVTLALAYPTLFAAAASHSGVLSPRFIGPRPYAPPSTYGQDSIGLKTASGGLWRYLRVSFGLDTLGWNARDPGRLAARAQKITKGKMPALLIDCGTADGHVHENRDFHATLTTLGVSHQYAEWPGNHDWNYWRAHVPESITFLLSHLDSGTGAR
ncbi:MAG: alpha/beta hydrolase [Gemmatimonas sp.]